MRLRRLSTPAWPLGLRLALTMGSVLCSLRLRQRRRLDVASGRRWGGRDSDAAAQAGKGSSDDYAGAAGSGGSAAQLVRFRRWRRIQSRRGVLRRRRAAAVGERAAAGALARAAVAAAVGAPVARARRVVAVQGHRRNVRRSAAGSGTSRAWAELPASPWAWDEHGLRLGQCLACQATPRSVPRPRRSA